MLITWVCSAVCCISAQKYRHEQERKRERIRVNKCIGDMYNILCNTRQCKHLNRHQHLHIVCAETRNNSNNNIIISIEIFSNNTCVFVWLRRSQFIVICQLSYLFVQETEWNYYCVKYMKTTSFIMWTRKSEKKIEWKSSSLMTHQNSLRILAKFRLSFGNCLDSLKEMEMSGWSLFLIIALVRTLRAANEKYFQSSFHFFETAARIDEEAVVKCGQELLLCGTNWKYKHGLLLSRWHGIYFRICADSI